MSSSNKLGVVVVVIVW